MVASEQVAVHSSILTTAPAWMPPTGSDSLAYEVLEGGLCMLQPRKGATPNLIATPSRGGNTDELSAMPKQDDGEDRLRPPEGNMPRIA